MQTFAHTVTLGQLRQFCKLLNDLNHNNNFEYEAYYKDGAYWISLGGLNLWSGDMCHNKDIHNFRNLYCFINQQLENVIKNITDMQTKLQHDFLYSGITTKLENLEKQ